MSVGRLFEGVGIALDSLRANKARAALTILGVAIGVTVVMVIAAMISGINKSVSDIFEQIAPRTFLVFRFFQAGVVVDDGSENAPWRRNPPISEAEVARVAELPSVRYVTSREESQTAVEFEDRRLESVFIAGLSSQWLEVNGGDVFPGRTFTRMEDLASAPVAVVNEKLVSQLFRGRDPIGQVVKIAGTPFAAIPHSAFTKYVPYFKGWMRLAVAPAAGATQQDAMDEVTATLRAMRGLKPGQDNTFSIVTQDKLLESWNQVTGVFFLVMLVLSSIGLMVGGVGVVALMMISVTERTREIGVRKALGATRREILFQFLVEASTLTLIGCTAGIILGALGAWAIRAVSPIDASIPMGSIVAAILS